MALAELLDVSEAVGLAAKVDFAGLAGAEVEAAVMQVQALKAQLAALEADAVAAYDASMQWSVGGHRSAGAALRHRCRMRGGDAMATVGLARKLRTMDGTALALADAVITQSHARRLCRSATRPEFEAAEAFLLRKATVLSFTDWERAVTYWEDIVDEARQDPGDPEPVDQRETNRALHLSKTLVGMGRLDGWLDPVGYVTVAEALRRIETEFFDNDWALAKAALREGESVTIDSLWRTAAQRRADALVEMAVRASTAPKDGKRPRPLVIVHTDAHTFAAEIAKLAGEPAPVAPDGHERLCELDDGTVISPTQMIEQAVLGDVRRLVYGSDGVILDYGRKVRLFEGVLREAICARDRWCDHPGCEIPARQCEIDHIVEWIDGGHTSHRNGKAKCSFHHRRPNTAPDDPGAHGPDRWRDGRAAEATADRPTLARSMWICRGRYGRAPWWIGGSQAS